jgi:transcriptional regulator with XRE-family HTH domain
MAKRTKKLEAADTDKRPHPVDLHVGAAVRLRRKTLGLSQEGLATSIDLTFQQVQKYERGSNRISASKLYEISRFLKVPIQVFFRGLDDDEAGSGFAESRSEKDVHAFLMSTEGIELAQAFPHVQKPAVRRKILDLVRALGDDPGHE